MDNLLNLVFLRNCQDVILSAPLSIAYVANIIVALTCLFLAANLFYIYKHRSVYAPAPWTPIILGVFIVVTGIERFINFLSVYTSSETLYLAINIMTVMVSFIAVATMPIAAKKIVHFNYREPE